MSAPVMVACSALLLALGLPVLAHASTLEAQQRASAAADASALAAADAASGWIDADPCAIAEETAGAMRAALVSCEVDEARAVARIVARTSAPLGSGEAVARAGPPFAPEVDRGGASGVGGAEGWSWPSDVRGITQGHHDGFSVDLAVSPGGGLYAPYDGVVVLAGPDGGGLPAACSGNPSWWRGPNHSVIIRHEFRGRTIYSSHSHIVPGSPRARGIVVGARVHSGQRVADAGMSGCTSGPHTHFTLSTSPTNAFSDLDPLSYIGAP